MRDGRIGKGSGLRLYSSFDFRKDFVFVVVDGGNCLDEGRGRRDDEGRYAED